jgi:signal transduction histidine kinase
MPKKGKLAAAGQALRLSEERLRVARKHPPAYELTVEPTREPPGRIPGITAAALEAAGRKRLEGEILRVIEMEQRRIGQDLHDGICQQLAGIELQSQSLAQALEKKARRQAAQAGQIARQLREVIGQTRSLARGLSPFILEARQCVPALKELAARTQKLFRVKCRFQARGPVAISDPAAATHLYRIAQEAVANAIRHGRAGAVMISLDSTGGKTVLAVTDNGTGFAAPARAGGGMGLRAMQYRAAMIGASLRVQTPAAGGTRILCSFQNTPSQPPK